VPATWKVSFGAIVPSSKGASNGYGGWGLRVWEATDKQRAVYAGVKEFWDISIPIQVRAVRRFGTEDWLLDDGTFKPDEVESGWADPAKIQRTVDDLDANIVVLDNPRRARGVKEF
jgi:hypothetical protein